MHQTATQCASEASAAQSVFQSTDLPGTPLTVTFDGHLALQADEARAFGEALATKYQSAQPFPHIVIDNFLPPEVIKRVSASFPARSLAHDTLMHDEYSHYKKRQIRPEDCDSFARSFFQFLNSSALLNFLEGLTGIEGLIGDPHFEGGGFHEISQGGKLGVHADFRINRKLHLERRLNLLLYLNENWQDSYGGALELWDDKMTASLRSIKPILNRCVIFNTEVDSFHGHPDPLNTPPGVTRRSVATYYYSASRSIYGEVRDNDTKWMHRPADSRKFRLVTARYRAKIFLKDFCPPFAYRALMRLIHK